MKEQTLQASTLEKTESCRHLIKVIPILLQTSKIAELDSYVNEHNPVAHMNILFCWQLI